MAHQDFELNHEPLWSIPQTMQGKGLLGPDNSDYRSFLLSGFYCAMNLFFLVLFGFYALTVGDSDHAAVLFWLAGGILVGYAAIWLGDWYRLAPHFTTGTMIIMCLYLFYSGGLQNTGPLYYFVFPSIALFLHGRLRGFLWVILLLLLTIGIWKGLFGFDTDRYSNVFVTRTVAICLLISGLACIPEYFRLQAERNLLLSFSDLEALTYGDLKTGLANRSLLEKLLQLEFNRNLRYGSACCLVFIEPDPVVDAVPGFRTEVNKMRLLKVFADILRKNLRVQDIAGRWENLCFLLVLPEISLEGAKLLAERLLVEVRAQGSAFGKYPVRITASIGIAALDKSPPEEVLQRAADSLLAVQRNAGNACLAR